MHDFFNAVITKFEEVFHLALICDIDIKVFDVFFVPGALIVNFNADFVSCIWTQVLLLDSAVLTLAVVRSFKNLHVSENPTLALLDVSVYE